MTFLVFSTVASVAEKVFADLSKVFKMKRTGTLEPKTKSVISFLGRNIYQKSDGGLFFGLKPGMLKACAEEYNVSRAAKLPKLERLWTSLEGKAVAISHEAYQRYRRVLGKLSWMALTRPDLQFAVGFLARSQANPDSRSEDCMRAVLRFVLSLGDRVQRIPAIWVDYVAASNLQTIDCFCDAAWNLPSVSGGIISWQMNPHQELLEKTVSCGALQRRSRALSSGGDRKRGPLRGTAPSSLLSRAFQATTKAVTRSEFIQILNQRKLSLLWKDCYVACGIWNFVVRTCNRKYSQDV